jgi:hypothetical protein
MLLFCKINLQHQCCSTTCIFTSLFFLTTPLTRTLPASSAALYPTLSLVTTGTFAVGGAKLRTYADACWQEAMENPYDKLIDASRSEAAAAAAAPGAAAATSSALAASQNPSQNQSQNQGSGDSMQANQPNQPQRAMTGAQIDARVAHTARSVGGMLLAGSAAWVGIHIVADQTLSSSSSSSENGATRVATTLATLLSAGFCAYGCVEYARAAVRLERKASRISKNVRANLAL